MQKYRCNWIQYWTVGNIGAVVAQDRTPFVVRLALLVKQVEYDEGHAVQDLDALVEVAVHDPHQMLEG